MWHMQGFNPTWTWTLFYHVDEILEHACNGDRYEARMDRDEHFSSMRLGGFLTWCAITILLIGRFGIGGRMQAHPFHKCRENTSNSDDSVHTWLMNPNGQFLLKFGTCWFCTIPNLRSSRILMIMSIHQECRSGLLRRLNVKIQVFHLQLENMTSR